MHEARYRPRSASEIVDAGFQLLRGHYRSFVTVTAVTYAPVLVALLVVQRVTGSTAREPQPAYMVTLLVVMVLWYSLTSGALTLAAADAYAARLVDPAAALRGGAARVGATLVASLAVYLAVVAGGGLLAGIGAAAGALIGGGSPIVIGITVFLAFVLMAVVALYLLTRWFAVPAAHMLEGIGPFAGMRRSWHLADDSKWRLLGTVALLWIIYLLLSLGFGAAGAITGSLAVQQVASALVAVLVYPLIPVTLTVLYYDARIRREGYDIELLERELGAPPAESTSSEQPAY